MYNKRELTTGEYYHIYSKSIAGYRIFNNPEEYKRIICAAFYYQFMETNLSISNFFKTNDMQSFDFTEYEASIKKPAQKYVSVGAFCLMPTHFHFVLRQLEDKGISFFMSRVLNSYTRYFNSKYRRQGPLWSGRFHSEHISTDEQLCHVIRYIHLNPSTAFLVERPEDWEFSSYREFLGKSYPEHKFCDQDVIDLMPNQYKKFVDGQIEYQRELAKARRFENSDLRGENGG